MSDDPSDDPSAATQPTAPSELQVPEQLPLPADPSNAGTYEQRSRLYAFLRQLDEHDREQLWQWIDGLWLGRASADELATLTQLAREYLDRRAASPPPSVGRPPATQLVPTVPSLLNKVVRDEWLFLAEGLKYFSAARRRHYARSNRTASGRIRPEHRVACLASEIGQLVARAGLFDEFFGDDRMPARWTPREMAAQLLHRRLRQRLQDAEASARREAARAPSAQRRELLQHQATKAATQLQQLGTWKTLLNKLERRR